MATVVPALYLAMGWKYDRRPSSPYRAPGGSLTIGGPLGVPCGADREVALYLARLASEAGPLQRYVRGSVNELRQWLGANHRAHIVRERLDRVLGCTVMHMQPAGGYEEIHIGRVHAVQGDALEIRLGDRFHEQCLQGAPYSIDVASRLRREPASLDLYLALVHKVRVCRAYPEFTHEFDPYTIIPQPLSSRRARQALRGRLARLRGAIPGVHLALADTGTGILIDVGEAPGRTVYTGANRAEWAERAEFGRSIRRMDPAKRRELSETVAQLGEMEKQAADARPLCELWDIVCRAGEQTAETFETIEQYADRLRKLKKGNG